MKENKTKNEKNPIEDLANLKGVNCNVAKKLIENDIENPKELKNNLEDFGILLNLDTELRKKCINIYKENWGKHSFKNSLEEIK